MSGALASCGVDAETEPLGPSEWRPEYKRTSLSENWEFPCEFGGYRLLSLLGSGGMGAVYEAEQLETGRRVALKMLSHRLVRDEAALERFEQEADLIESLRNPAITACIRLIPSEPSIRTLIRLSAW